MRKRGVLGGLTLGLAALFCVPTNALAATNIGVTSAVLPQAHGAPPQEASRVLRIGVDIVADERVTTDAGGKLQLLFLDGSALTVGPNSDVTIDEFVYDPKAKTGKLAFSTTKGLFRLVGGKISKKTPVLLRTPTAVIGIRGGIATARASATAASGTFLFGQEMTLTSGGQTVTANNPGFRIDATGGQPPGAPTQVTSQEISSDMNSLESNADQSDQAGVSVGDDDVAGTQLADLGSAGEPVDLGGGPVRTTDPVGNTEQAETTTGLKTTSQQQATDESEKTAGTTSTDTTSTDTTSTDTTPSGLTLTGFEGRGKRGTATLTGTLDTDSTQNLALSDITISGGTFQVSTSQGDYSLFVPSSAGSFTLEGTNTTPNGSVTGSGLLTDDQDFILYELNGSQELVFAGVPTPSSAFPTSGVTVYDVRDDFTLGGSNIPFIPNARGGSLTPLNEAEAAIYWGASGSGAQSSFFTGTLAISGSGSSQTHALSMAVGEVRTDSGDEHHLRGDARGSSLISSTSDFYLYDGEIATQDGGGGADFFGQSGPYYAVLGAEEVDTSDVTQDRGLEEAFGSTNTTIYPNAPLIRDTDSSDLGSTRTTQTLNAYVGGVARDFNSSGTFLGVHKFFSANTTSTTTVNSATVPSNRIQTNASNNTVEGAFVVDSPYGHGIQTATLGFGGVSDNEHSGFIDDGHYGATEPSGNSDIGMFRNTDVSLSSLAPSGSTICTCSYVQWGPWMMRYVGPASSRHDSGLAWWVAGSRLTSSSLYDDVSGSFSGTVIGTVANGAHESNGTVQIYTAVGTYSFSVAFDGTYITVSNGTMSVDSGSYTFSGNTAIGNAEYFLTLTGSRSGTSLSGQIKGGFAGAPANTSSAPMNSFGYFAAAASDTDITYQIAGPHFSKLSQ